MAAAAGAADFPWHVVTLTLGMLLVAALVWFFGWEVLLYVLGAIVLLAVLTWTQAAFSHARKCRWCAAARAYVQERHPELEVRASLEQLALAVVQLDGDFVVVDANVGDASRGDVL